MKNIKNTLAAIGLMAVLGVGAVTANAEAVTSETNGQCLVENDGVLGQLADILNGLTGISIFDEPCDTDEKISPNGFRRGRVEMNGFRRA